MLIDWPFTGDPVCRRRLREAIRIASEGTRRCCAACGGPAAAWGALRRTHVAIPTAEGAAAGAAQDAPAASSAAAADNNDDDDGAAAAAGGSGVFSPRGGPASTSSASAYFLAGPSSPGSRPLSSPPAPPVALGWSADFEAEVVRSGTQFPEGEKRYVDGPAGTICAKCGPPFVRAHSSASLVSRAPAVRSMRHLVWRLGRACM